MSENGIIHPQLERLEKTALKVGAAGLALCAVGALLNLDQFFRSYLLGYLFWAGITLGSFGLLMVHHLSGGGWGYAIRRCLESAIRTLPLVALLLVPILLGVNRLYIWTDAELMATDHILHGKQPYLNVPFFMARAVLYFLIWGVYGWMLNKWSFEQDRTKDPKLSRRLEVISGPGLVLLGLTITFASVDWVMSLDPHWFSTMYGLIFVVGDVLATLSFAICLITYLSDREPLAGFLKVSHYHDLGNLMLAFVMLWAYLSFSQYLIIWSGNLPEETPWYIHRTGHGWSAIAIVLIIFHFALPFVLLLSRKTKRVAATLVKIAAFVLVMRLVDLFWQVAPAFYNEHLTVHWMDLAAPVAIGGLWVWFFARQMKDKPLLPLHDPGLAEAGGEA